MINELDTITEKEFKQRGQRAVTEFARSLTEIVNLVAVADKRGFDLAWCPPDLLPWCRKIAAGTMLESVYFFADTARQRLAMLTPKEQERIIDSGAVEIAIVDANGAYGKKKYPLEVVKASQWKQLISDSGELLNYERQISYLDEQREKAARKVAKPFEDVIEIDKRRNGFIIGGVFVTKNQLLTKMMELK